MRTLGGVLVNSFADLRSKLRTCVLLSVGIAVYPLLLYTWLRLPLQTPLEVVGAGLGGLVLLFLALYLLLRPIFVFGRPHIRALAQPPLWLAFLLWLAGGVWGPWKLIVWVPEVGGGIGAEAVSMGLRWSCAFALFSAALLWFGACFARCSKPESVEGGGR